MATITISRQFGAGGRTLGKSLAKRLGYHFVDDVMVKEVAGRMNVSSKQVEAFEKEGASSLMKILDKFISKDYIDRLISDKYGYVHEKKYVDSIEAIVNSLHKEGNVVIIGRGSQYILKDQPDAYHILLVRELKDRINFLTKQYKMKSEAEVKKTVNRIDKNRENFLNFFSESDSHDDPLCYDLTINTKNVSLEKAADLIINLIL